GPDKKEWLAKRSQVKLKVIQHLAADDGKDQQAAAAVEELLKDGVTPALKLSLAGGLGGFGTIADGKKMTALVDGYAGRAVALIREVYLEGHFRQNPSAGVLRVFRGIAPIARRADFQRLAKEIESKQVD